LKSASTETHLVLIPSYNTGPVLLSTVMDALRHWPVVWVVVDGSTDGSDRPLADLCKSQSGLHVIYRAQNGGKGAAVFDGLQVAAAQNFTHVLVMDADGQHPVQSIAEFMRISKQNRGAMVLGAPRFDTSAPRIRVIWRKMSNVLTRLETAAAISDSLFGFRVYPLADLLSVMRASPWMRGFDFDPEAIVRLSWRGIAAINQPAPVRYFAPADGGISHFRYGRDNFLLAAMHARLLAARIAHALRTSAKPLVALSHGAID
jgi:glycosyltransferase involved in cell wall biosynthesis